MTKEEAITRLIELQKDDDREVTHSTTDAIICDFLETLGYGDVIEEYDKIGKWYA